MAGPRGAGLTAFALLGALAPQGRRSVSTSPDGVGFGVLKNGGFGGELIDAGAGRALPSRCAVIWSAFKTCPECSRSAITPCVRCGGHCGFDRVRLPSLKYCAKPRRERRVSMIHHGAIFHSAFPVLQVLSGSATFADQNEGCPDLRMCEFAGV